MKLSIIMPCYNVADTLDRAIESILWQRTDYEYEIIIIDDASTDATAEIALGYVANHENIRYFKNEENAGNAHSFYRGLCESTGEYFCVLDGDDYYSTPSKLEKQIRFLEQDLKEEYVAVATNFVIDFGDGTVHIPNRAKVTEFTYIDLMLSRHAYLHTATYMYRNIFKDSVPEYFDMKLYRGDTPRTLFHLMYSGKKVRVLDFVGSVYSYTLEGIWSACNEKDHFAYQVNFYKEHGKYVRTEFEKQYAERMAEQNQSKLEKVGDEVQHHYPQISIEQALKEIRRIANTFAFKEREIVLREIYASEYIDTLCETLGYIARIHEPDLRQVEVDESVVCILVSRLNPHGGGIFTEIRELAGIFSDKEIFIFQTEGGDIDEDAYHAFELDPNVHLVSYPSEIKEPFHWLSRKIRNLAPYRAYFYCSHNDTYSQALMDDGPCENICLFSFDHGYIVGIFNDCLDVIAAKRPVDYRLLSKCFKDKLIYLPAWSNREISLGEEAGYQPYADHEGIVTASGAARYYKVNGEAPYRYIDIVMRLLTEFGGVHYHYGQLPDSVLFEIRERLDQAGLPEDRFVHIEWAQDMPGDLLNNHVDLFIEPFPTVSYKMTLNVLSVGVPVAAWRSLKRMSTTDFIPPDSIWWHNEQSLIDEIAHLTKSELEVKSKSALAYFKKNHAKQAVAPFIRENRTMPIEVSDIPYYADDEIHDIADYLPLFGMTNIAVMKRVLDEQRRTIRLNRRRKSEEKKALKACCQVRDSRSFKIGYVVTAPLRGIKKCCKGVSSTTTACEDLHHMPAAAFVEHYGPKKSLLLVKRIKESRTYRVGRLLTAPARAVKKIIR